MTRSALFVIGLFASSQVAAQVQVPAPSVPVQPSVPAIIAPSVPEGITIEDIRIEGLQRIEPGTVFSYLPVRIGEVLSATTAAEAVRALFATGFFQDVRIEIDGRVLVVLLEERPAIGAIEITGAKEFDAETLKKALGDAGLSEARIFDRAVLERAEQELKRQYLGRGKYDVQVQATVSPLPRNRVAVSIAIDEGDDAKIKEIRIVGANAFSEKTLLDEFKLSTPTWMSWYTKSDQYSRQKLTGDLESLRSFYLNRGYLEFAIDSTQVSLSADRRDVFITLVVKEGEKFNFGEFQFVGDMLDQPDTFKALNTLKAGETFSNERLQEVLKAMTDKLGSLGYAFGNVSPIPRIDRQAKTVDFTLQVDPGRRVYVRRINISGNARTRDEVIRREMRQFESSWYDSERIRISRNRIDRLGYFNIVEVDREAVPGTSDQVDVNVKVEERPLGSLTFGLGYSSSESVVLSGSISQQNFMGTGTNVSLEVNTSRVSQVFAIRHVDPYFTDDGISRSLDLYTRTFNADEIDSLADYSIVSTGLGVRFGIPYTEEDRIFLGLAFENSKLSGDPESPNWDEFRDEFGDQANSVLASIGWARDSRDSGLAPTSGRYQVLNLDYGTPIGDLEYLRITYGDQYFFPISKRITLALNADLGFGTGLFGKPYPAIKNFYAGGIGSVRGFSSSSIGPRSKTTNDAIGGSKRVVFNTELLFPLPGMSQDRSIRVFTYFDAGSVWGDEQTPQFSDLRASAGVGLSWFSPVGPLKLSFGQPIKKQDGDETESFQFQIGSSF
ncbi:MAG: outer membrane protein assembly factor BamA [Burkholderiaceae bacterium]